MPRWRSAFADVATALHSVERWLLPGSCLLCAEPVPSVEGDSLVCALCRLRWRPVSHPLCARCGQPLDGGASCLLCHDWPPGLSRVRSAVWLEGTAREVAHRLKYDGWWRAAESMADAMRYLEPLTGRVSLVPIPLGARRRRIRGYNQSEQLARALGTYLGVSVRPEWLARVRETKTQTALTPKERRANVEGAFAAEPAAGANVILVDDVFTTGATLIAAAAALRSAGAARVDAVTFARAVAPVTNLVGNF